jgi:hypothetical protein
VAQSGLGFNPEMPLLETDEEALRQAKKPWNPIRMRGNVEARFLYATLPSGSLVPFGCLKLQPVVLPIEPAGGRYRLVDAGVALEQGHLGLREWLRTAQEHWERDAVRDEDKVLTIANPLARIDYQHGLTRQSSELPCKVLYGRSGTNISAAVISTVSLRHLAQSHPIPTAGFIVDSTNHYGEFEEEQEANFVATILNSGTLDALIKPMQTRGLWGERDIYQLAWQLNIPQFDPADVTHQRLAALGRQCHERVAAIAPELAARNLTTARARAAVRDHLRAELAEIDGLVRGLLRLPATP